MHGLALVLLMGCGLKEGSADTGEAPGGVAETADHSTDSFGPSATDEHSEGDTSVEPVDSGVPDTAADTAAAEPCGHIPTFADGRVPTRVRHVATTGSDATGDGSKAQPFATIEGAAEGLLPGDAIRLAPGSYEGGQYLSEVRGRPDAPIWVGGEPGADKPVLVGATEGLHLVRAAYVLVHDLEVSGASGNGINADDGGDYEDEEATHHLVFRDLDIHDIGGDGNQDCLKLSGLRDFVVMDSRFARCGGGGSGSGVDHVGCHRGLVARNSFSELGASGVQAKGGSTDVELRWNHLVDAGDRAFNMGGSTDPIYFRPPLDPAGDNAEARDIRAIANLIEGSEAALAFVGCVDCAALNNTIVSPDKWVLRILQESTSGGGYSFLPAAGGELVNNLVQLERSAVSTDVNIGPDTDSDSFVFTTNLWYAADEPGDSAPVLPGTVVGGIAGVDPMLQTDGSVGEGSPAIAAGTADGRVAGDRSGACYADPPTIGAHAAP